MTDDFNHLERLYRLLDEGRITDDEFDLLRASLVAGSPDPSSEGPQTANRGEPARDLVSPPSSEPAPESETDLADGSEGDVPTVGQETPGIYLACLVLGVVSVFIGGSVGAVAWGTVAVSLVVLLGFKAKPRRWMAWVGLTLGILYSLLNAYSYGHLDGLMASIADDPSSVESGEPQFRSGQPSTTTSTYSSWMTNGRVIAGTQAEADFLAWLRASGQFINNIPTRIEEVSLVEEGLWFCRGLDIGHYVEDAFERKVDEWVEAMSWSGSVKVEPEQLDKAVSQILTVMDASTHTLCPEYGAKFDRWIRS